MANAIKPQPGEWWMTEKGSMVGPLVLFAEKYFFADVGGSWYLHGEPNIPNGSTVEKYGNLTHRCNPDGTPWKARKPINYQRLALRMSKAASIREVRKIYAEHNGKKALDHKREEEG